MTKLLCKECGSGKSTGSRQLYAATAFERAEYQRITRGIARQPTVEQRTIYVNDVPQPVMDLAFYNCDLCLAEIRPGDEAVAQTVWRDDRPEPGDWESAYFEESV